MISKSRRRSAGQRSARTQLSLECLEDRRLLDASSLVAIGPSSLDTPERVLVAYQDNSTAIVHHVKHGASLEKTLAAYASDSSVRFAEPDFRVHAAVTPNDSYFRDVWGLHNTGQNGGLADADIDAPEAWDLIQGSIGTVVAIIDSGIDYLHPDLYRNVWINQGEIPSTILPLLVDLDGDALITFRDLNDPLNQGIDKITDLNGNGIIDGRDLLYDLSAGGWADGISNDGDTYVDDLIGWNFVKNTNDPFDDHGHGTHVAGTVGADGNNSRGIAGVLWEVQLVGLKFLDATGGGYVSSAIAALNYAVAKSIDISNNSWGGGGYSQALYDAINAARIHGHVFVAAAGNGGSDGIGDDNDALPQYPSSYNLDNIVAVAATDKYDKLAGFSNYGATSVDVAAPGVEILSTVPGGFAYASGTSMAAPHVTGVVAMVQAQNPSWTYSQTIAQVLNKADQLTGLQGKLSTGARLNAHGAVSAALPDTTGPRIISAVPNASATSPVSSVRVTFNEAIDPASFTLADISDFSGPNGTITPTGVAAVSGSGDKSFDVTFASQSSPGTYRFSVGPDVLDQSGNAMDQDQDGIVGESTEDRYHVQFVIDSSYTYSSSPGAPIRDGYATVVSINVDRDIKIADLNVKLDISHTYDADLRMYLIAPDGSWISLIRHRGGSGDHFKGTLLDDEASTPIAYGKAPFSGSYRPEYSLSAFDGKNARGTWKLQVEDWYRKHTGKINSWSLTFEGAISSTASASFDEASAKRSARAAERQLLRTRLGAGALPDTDRAPTTPINSGGFRDDQFSKADSNRKGERRSNHRGLSQPGETLDKLSAAIKAADIEQIRSRWTTAVDDLMGRLDKLILRDLLR